MLHTQLQLECHALALSQGWGKGALSKYWERKKNTFQTEQVYSKGSHMQRFLYHSYCNLKLLTLRSSSWFILSLSSTGLKEMTDSDSVLPCGYLLDAGNPTLSSVEYGTSLFQPNRNQRVSVPTLNNLLVFALFYNCFSTLLLDVRVFYMTKSFFACLSFEVTRFDLGYWLLPGSHQIILGNKSS